MPLRATEFAVQSRKRKELLDLTSEIRKIVKEYGWREGILFIHIPHTTAGLVLNENADPNVGNDILSFLSRLVPKEGDYAHEEGNSDSHIQSSLVGNQAFIPVLKGDLQLGRWEGIFLAEYDGPRTRTVRLYFLEP
jgi:secondary thiamine-phosphate synthase enzyme